MPANLTPQYREAEREFREAKSTDEKIACLEKMLAIIPKHKGTDHMQADLKRKLSHLRETAESERKGKKHGITYKVEKEGAGQIVLLGPPNAGKSRLLTALTKAQAHVADYPFTTQMPQPGMAAYEDVQIQLIDLPPVTADYMEAWVQDMIRRADAALLVADLSSDDVIEGIEVILNRLEQIKITLAREIPPDAETQLRAYRRAAILANKLDAQDSDVRLDLLRERFAAQFDIWPASAETGTAMDAVPRRLFDLLRVIRVYTKQPGKKPDMDKPYTVPAGITVVELAGRIHKEFEQSLKSARVWGSGKYEGMHVKRDHVLSDKDVVELQE